MGHVKASDQKLYAEFQARAESEKRRRRFEVWSQVVNGALEDTGDPDGAIRVANAHIKRMK